MTKLSVKAELEALRAENALLKWNDAHLMIVPVRFWTGAKEGPGRMGKTYSKATIVGGSAVVYIRDESGKNVGCVCLTHVEPIQEDQAGGGAIQ